MFMGPPIGCKKDSACIYHSILSCPGPINCKSNSHPINREKKLWCTYINTGWYYSHRFFFSFRPIIQLVVVQLPENGCEKSANSERFSWARNGGKLLKYLLKPIPMLIGPQIGCKKTGSFIYHSLAQNGGKLLKSLLKPIPMLMGPRLGCKKDGACIYHSNTVERILLTPRASF